MDESQSISRWLEDLEVEFSSFEDDFANGYLIGMILYRYSFQDDFGQFSNKASYALSNLSKVQLSLERLQIKFDPHRLINKEPAYSLKLLTKLHKAIHSQNNSRTVPMNPHSTAGIPIQTKQEKLALKLKKFEDFRLVQLDQIEKQEKQQREILFKTKLKERSNRIEILKTNKTFMQTWQHDGMQNWIKNQQRRKARILHENTVKAKISNDKVHRARASNEFYMNDTSDGIKEFERNMIRLGIDHTGDSEKKIVKQDLAVEAAATMAKIKENKKKNIEAAKEREVRQRNSYIEQKKNEKFDIYKKASVLIANKLINFLNKAYRESFITLLASHKKGKRHDEVEKNIQSYKLQSDEKWKSANRKRAEELEFLELSSKKEKLEKKKKLSQTAIETMKKAHMNHTEICRPIAKDIILLANQAFDYIAFNKKIPSGLWNEWLSIFKNKDHIKPSEAQIHQSENFQELENSHTEHITDDVNSYISGKGSWGPLPENFFLSDLLEEIVDCAFPLSPPPPIPEGPLFLPLKILIIGAPFSGKKTLFKKLSDTFGLKLFEMLKIVEDAKKVVQKKAEPEDLKKKKVADEESEVFTQAALETSLSDELGRAKLFRAKIRGIFGDNPKTEQEEAKKQGKKEEPKVQGFALINYPSTLQEAVDLERQLSGFIHPNELPPEERDLKKQEVFSLLRRRPKVSEPIKLFNSAWDLVIWLNFDENLALKRASDRRIDPAGTIYNLSYNPPSDNILAKCKPVESPTEDQIIAEFQRFYEKQPQLLHWFSLFGSKDTQNLLKIDASQHPDVIYETVKNRAHELIHSKTSGHGSETSPEPKLDQRIASELYEEWERLKSGYISKVTNALHYSKKVWDDFDMILKKLIESFLAMVKENDEKKPVAEGFLWEFNSILTSKSIFAKEDTEDLYEKIDSLSDNLWDIVTRRKQSFVEQRGKLLLTFNIDEKLIEIANAALNLFQTELFKYISSINLIRKYKNLKESSSFSIENIELQAEVTLPVEGSLQVLLSKFSDIIRQDDFLHEENALFIFRINTIYSWAVSNIANYKLQVKQLFEKFDDWIVESVQLENAEINKFTNYLHESFRSKQQASCSFPLNSEILSGLK